MQIQIAPKLLRKSIPQPILHTRRSSWLIKNPINQLPLATPPRLTIVHFYRQILMATFLAIVGFKLSSRNVFGKFISPAKKSHSSICAKTRSASFETDQYAQLMLSSSVLWANDDGPLFFYWLKRHVFPKRDRLTDGQSVRQNRTQVKLRAVRCLLLRI